MTNSDNGHENQSIKVSINPQIIELIKNLNINTKTLLSTDYLNHFNEIIMMIAMIPDMPEILDECREWQPKTYIEHFARTSLSYKDIAIELYKIVPVNNRKAFENIIEQINSVIFQTIERLDISLQSESKKQVSQKVEQSQKALQKLTEIASSIIHGAERALSQDEIDNLLAF